MPIADAIARIDEIRTTIDAIEGRNVAATDSVSATTSSAPAFESALDRATYPEGVSGEDVIARAREYLGVPYVFGGTTRAGMDCSGLIQTVFKELGVNLPRLGNDQATQGVAVPSLAEAKPGDLIELKGHIVIYAGDNKVIHAPYPGRVVSEQPIWFKESEILNIRRIVPSEKPAAVSAASVQSTGAPDVSQLLALLSGSGGGLFGSASQTSSVNLLAAAQMSLFTGGTAQ